MRDNFQQMADSLGGIYSASNSDIEALLDGDFTFHGYSGGLSTHVSQAMELQNASNFVELPACISFNILFEGRIDIALANQEYQLGPASNQAVECSAIISPEPEVLTRRIKKGTNICKLNLFVERSWLETRCQNANDTKLINKLFNVGTAFIAWKASKEIVKQARELIQKNKGETLYDNINDELLTIKLLLACMAELEQQIDIAQIDNQSVSSPRAQHHSYLKKKVDALLSKNYSLQEIATVFNLSVSTLQRRFKKAYGTTVSVYCHQRRLEMAKKSLLLEDISIGEAAYMAGYSHPSNFITAFKKRFLITPAAFISKHKGMHLT